MERVVAGLAIELFPEMSLANWPALEWYGERFRLVNRQCESLSERAQKSPGSGSLKLVGVNRQGQVAVLFRTHMTTRVHR